MRFLALPLLLAVAGCSTFDSVKFWEKGYEFQAQTLPIKELRRALICDTPTEEPRLQLYDNAAALLAAPVGQRLQADTLSLPADASFVVLEQGLRRTGGYSIELRKTVQVDDTGLVRLQADWLEPAPDRMRIQILTSLCVLAQIPQQPYTAAVVRDGSDAERARWQRLEE